MRILRASWWGTALFASTAVAATVAPAVLDVPALAVSLGLFVAGVALFAGALVVAASRSRSDEIDLAGLFGLSGSAPRWAQYHLLGSLAVEVVVALVTAAVRPYTVLAFGVLTPLYGLGMAALWAARHGKFPEREVGGSRRRARRS